MKSVISKVELLDVIKGNKDKHRDIFLKAIIGYREEALRLLEKMIEKLKSGKTIDQFINLPVPVDHTPEYNRAIKMIEMDVRGEIELEEEEFAQFVMDDWQWKREWIGTVSNYTAVTMPE
jgi:hypothetical protein